MSAPFTPFRFAASLSLTDRQMHALTIALKTAGLIGDGIVNATGDRIGSGLYITVLRKSACGALYEWSGRMNLTGRAKIRLTCFPAKD